MGLHKEIELRIGSIQDLARYVSKQLSIFLPSAEDEYFEIIKHNLPRTLKRMEPILSRCKPFKPGIFDHLHSMQNATFLYMLANEIWISGEECGDVCEKLFILNKIFSGIDLYYKVIMPEIFLINHGNAAVLVATKYGEKIVISQSVTVGRLGDAYPVIGSGVIIYPNAVISGDSNIGDYAVISAGTIIHNKNIPPNSVVFSNGSNLVIKKRETDYLSHYFR